MNSLYINNLIIQRGEHPLCQPMTVSIKAGAMLHVTGKNGVGKTTLLKMLANIIPAPKGQLVWHQDLPHQNPSNQKPSYKRHADEWQTLFIGHNNALQTQLSVYDNLHYLHVLFASNKQIKKATKKDYVWALEQVGLADYQETLCCYLSSGQKRRVQLARLWLIQSLQAKKACVNQLWLLDEPFTALDVTMMRDVEVLLQKFLASGGRIILTSHQPLNLPCQQYELVALQA